MRALTITATTRGRRCVWPGRWEFAGGAVMMDFHRGAAVSCGLLGCGTAPRRLAGLIAHQQGFSTSTAAPTLDSKLSLWLPARMRIGCLCNGMNNNCIFIHLPPRCRSPGQRWRAAPANNKT